MSEAVVETWHELGQSVGVGVEGPDADASIRVCRLDDAAQLDAEIYERLDLRDAYHRRLAWSILWGIRLGFDGKHVAYHADMERDAKPERVFHPREVPSVYGERLPHLVDDLVVAWIEHIAQKPIYIERGLLAETSVLYVLEVGRCSHVLTREDLQTLPFSEDKLRRDARYALFYQSYRVRPRISQLDGLGVVRSFQTSEGLGCSRLLLLPDYDNDAALAGGLAAAPDRNSLLVAEPTLGTPGVDFESAFRREVELRYESAQRPMASDICAFDLTGVRVSVADSRHQSMSEIRKHLRPS